MISALLGILIVPLIIFGVFGLVFKSSPGKLLVGLRVHIYEANRLSFLLRETMRMHTIIFFFLGIMSLSNVLRGLPAIHDLEQAFEWEDLFSRRSA